MEQPVLISLADVEQARTRIARYIRHTPLEPAYELSQLTNSQVHLKLESLQVTGSFKPRISFNKLLSLTEEKRKRGAIASTAGGHGIGLSYAGLQLGVPIDVYLPETTDPRKVAIIERQRAKLKFFSTVEKAREAALATAEAENRLFVSAYNDRLVIAGGGTVALEIVEDIGKVDLLIVGMGGGGLISGMATVLKANNPQVAVWGVQPENSPVLATWLEAGRPVSVATKKSIADGLGAQLETGSITFPIAQRLVDRTILVSEAEIKQAMLFMLENHQMVVEPSGAAPIAALIKTKPTEYQNIVIVVTGRNISRERYFELLGISVDA